MKVGKIDKEKDAVKVDDFASTIFKLRSKRNLTQKNLADLIQVSDRTISKWENGQTIPDLINIRNICDELGVSPSSLIHNKPTIRDVLTKIKLKLATILKHIFKNIFLIVFIILFILLLISFINHREPTVIYKLKYNSENISIDHGYFFKSDITNILIIDNINIVKVDYKEKSLKLELYTYVEGDKHIIFSSDKLDDIFIEEQSKYPTILTSYVIDGIMKNMYLDITVTDTKNKEHVYSSTITLKDKMTNDGISEKHVHKDDDFNNNELTFKENKYASSIMIPDTVAKLYELGYEYNEEDNKYVKTDEYGGIIEYYLTKKKIKYTVKSYKNFITIVYSKENNIELSLIGEENYSEILCENSNNQNKICKKYSDEISRVLSIYEKLS